MQALNFPRFDFRFKKAEDNLLIFDVIRKKFVLLQPEEWVRQHVVHFLLTTKGYPKSLMNVEKQLIVNKLSKRYDVVVFKPDSSIFLLVECKAPQVKITQDVFDQIARYNRGLGATYLMVTNGLEHYYCQMDYVLEKYTFLKEIPDFSR
ncbi:MAG: restriction endonuclease subunit R [Muricauda sp.]|nr:type I restriction enzyme HsdR N-terminal domain-containing protein [Allomuricauda sp.]MBC29419.1 restriction endonuclease subunit R [Allomuricauda sp.]|tara:strand:- start:163 stop:609 length:447 start_codon:yes stop_codon:yes gene_type:complete